jgi:hypothetical protein
LRQVRHVKQVRQVRQFGQVRKVKQVRHVKKGDKRNKQLLVYFEPVKYVRAQTVEIVQSRGHLCNHSPDIELFGVATSSLDGICQSSNIRELQD